MGTSSIMTEDTALNIHDVPAFLLILVSFKNISDFIEIQHKMQK